MQIDHVELFVPDRHEAARWYEAALGLKILREHEDWAAHPKGPLMISSDGGHTKLALFAGAPRGNRETAGHHRVAFRTEGQKFLRFLDHLEQFPIFDEAGQRVTRRKVVDHDKAFSIYFCDPYGHRYEVTTYDYDYTVTHLSQLNKK